MSYLKFDRRLMANLDESTQREYIRTNRKGAYCCSSIVGCNTRKYHGVLVVPIPTLSPNNHVLLSSLDLTIVQHGVPFNVGIHEYEGDVFSPKGHKYIREYNVDVVSSTTYRVGGVVLRKEFIFCHYVNRALIRYTLLEAHSQTTLRLSPFLAFRDVKMLTHRNDQLDGSYQEATSGVSFCLYPGYPRLYLQLSKQGRFVSDAHWNERIEYIKERERGYEYTEDLYVPGYFELDIELGESIYFSAGLDEADPRSFAQLFGEELAMRTVREDFRSCLLNSALQFYYRPDATHGYLLAGYPWFGVRARDLFVALPGCSIYADAPERYYRIMDTAIPELRNFMNQVSISQEIRGINEPDVGLWAVWALQQYAAWSSPADMVSRYGDFLDELIHYYLRNVHPNLRIDETGLCYILGDGKPLSWMDAKIDGQAVVRREGYLVEVNALWYNALCFYREVLPSRWTPELEELVGRVQTSFCRTFINEHGYLFDYVLPHHPQDWSVRPNMIFAASLPYSPLPKSTRRSVVEIITRELRTPKGLRSLSPKSEGYQPQCHGTQLQRERAYYNGSVWPWLLGAYFEAYLKLYGRGAFSFIERTLIGMEEELQEHGVGTISELFDGNPPFKGRGAISFAMSVGEILRSLHLLGQAQAAYDTQTLPMIRYE